MYTIYYTEIIIYNIHKWQDKTINIYLWFQVGLRLDLFNVLYEILQTGIILLCLWMIEKIN